MAFQGSLAELHLPDIIQLISVSGKTGVFHLVDGPPSTGRSSCTDGKIVHAELDDLAGEEAVYALAIWSRASSSSSPASRPPRQTISKSNTNLLMEAARRLDEWRVLSKKIPSTDLVPEFVVHENREGQINLNTSEWLILSKIDGERTVRQIAAAAGLGVFDAAKMLYGLVADQPDPPQGAQGGGRRRRPGPECARSRPAGPGTSRPPSPGSRPPSRPPPAGRRATRRGLRDECIGLLGPGRRERRAEALPARARRDRARRRPGGDRRGHAADRPRRRHPQGQRRRRSRAPSPEPLTGREASPAAGRSKERQRSRTTCQRYSAST